MGDLRPPRVDETAARPPSSTPRAVGQRGPRFFDAPAHQARAADRVGTAARSIQTGERMANHEEPDMTGVAEQLKTDAVVADERLTGRLPAAVPASEPATVTALLVDHVTKRFVIGRKKKSVVAIDDVSLTIPRGE